ncbi:MAG TPA: hypothetical protein VNT79_16660, partial [Phycisphaerae bacterium]|nr:hypothetical protein [Phycisphaerae bacterium]
EDVDGATPADKTLTVPIVLTSIDGIAISTDGRAFLSDSSNHAIYNYNDFGTLPDGTLEQPDATIEGTDTGLSVPRQMFLVEP